MIREGIYSGLSEGVTFQFRIELAAEDKVRAVSGDMLRGSEFIGSFVCARPALAESGRLVEGKLVFRGNPELFTGSFRVEVDARGVGAFQVAIDMEGGFRDVFAGRLDWQGSSLRRLTVEIDGIRGTNPPLAYTSRDGSRITIERAFSMAGFDVKVIVDPFSGRGSTANRTRGYTLAEIHRAMQDRRSHVPSGRLHTHVFVCSFLAGRGNRGTLGIMYDFGRSDLNRRPREGVAVFYDHPLLSDPRIDAETRNREYVHTAVHEIGHALNLLHSFDKARPAALSWMNYPDLYPLGEEAPSGHDGTDEYWRRFKEVFDEEELFHLHHASPREIQAGGFPFGTYEEGESTVFGGPAEPRRTRLGANPLRRIRSLNLTARTVKGADYELGEPVLLALQVRNDGPEAVRVPDALDPSEGYLRLLIRTPAGRTVRYEPPVKMCKKAQMFTLPPGGEMPPFEHIPVFLGAAGPVFTEPGVYEVAAELAGIEGSMSAVSGATRFRVLPPDAGTERFAAAVFERQAALEALYLRHPLADREGWGAVRDELKAAGLGKGNTTESYFNYIAGSGWLNRFALLDGGEMPENLAKALEYLQKVDPNGLPPSVGDRKKRLPELIKAAKPKGRKPVAFRREELARAEVPPAGLFGALGLDRPEKERTGLSPFARIVKTLKGSVSFADVVSWNIEHLHSPANFGKIPKVAELIRNFRCDFWGLQEVDRESLQRLADTINSSGNVRYEFQVVSGKGQQSGALFRVDTTSVNVLPAPAGFFQEKLKVKLAGGGTAERSVFYRPPLLCDVRVEQAIDKVFDFRCAVVHLKSTDTSLKDTGDSLRAAAARELARWIEHDRALGAERDYLIMGDMNAETANQGLEPFTTASKLKLLSVGMRDKYGKAEALTRVASGRLLDHIVVTDDAIPDMPAQDKKEQLIVRADTQLSQFTSAYSDHVPVAVRFVLGVDKD